MDWKVDWELSERVIGAAFDVHRDLGPGMIEHVYEECFCWQLVQRGIQFSRQQYIPLRYHSLNFPGAFRLDVLVEKRLIVEVKSVEELTLIHKCQLGTYLRMCELETGLLINFNSWPLKHGIKRVVNPKKLPQRSDVSAASNSFQKPQVPKGPDP